MKKKQLRRTTPKKPVGMSLNKALLWVIGINLVLLAFKIYDLSLARYALYGDEAQYWTWAKALDWGYYSKPPVLAWLIALTTYLFGDDVFAVRLASPILHLFTSLFIFGIARRTYTLSTGFWAAITYATLPAVTLSSSLISTDPALLFCWSLSLYTFVRALETDRLCWWLLLGVGVGFGLLTKYSMLFIGLSTLLYVWWEKRLVSTVLNPKTLIAVLVAFIIYLPNLLWNMRHGFVSFRHTGDNAEGGGFGFYPGELAEFFISQFGVFGPILFIALLVLLYKAAKERDIHGPRALMLAFILPPLVVISVISLLSRAHANWAATIYVAATVWVVAWLLQTGRRKWLIAAIIMHVVAAGIFYSYPKLVAATGTELTRKIDPFRRLKGHPEFARAVAERQKQFPGARLVAEERRLVASFMYYLGKKRDENGTTRITPARIYKWNGDGKVQDQYDLVTDMNKERGRNFLLISRTVEPWAIGKHFDSMTKLEPIRIQLYPDYTLRYDVYYLENFQGY